MMQKMYRRMTSFCHVCMSRFSRHIDTHIASWWTFFASFLGPSRHLHLTRSLRLMDRSWWNLVQNEAEVVLVLFLVSTFCEFGVKRAKTSVVVQIVIFFLTNFYNCEAKWDCATSPNMDFMDILSVPHKPEVESTTSRWSSPIFIKIGPITSFFSKKHISPI